MISVVQDSCLVAVIVGMFDSRSVIMKKEGGRQPYSYSVPSPPPISKAGGGGGVRQKPGFSEPESIEKHGVWDSGADPNPDPDPHVFGPPGSGSTSQRYGSGSGSFYH